MISGLPGFRSFMLNGMQSSIEGLPTKVTYPIIYLVLHMCGYSPTADGLAYRIHDFFNVFNNGIVSTSSPSVGVALCKLIPEDVFITLIWPPLLLILMWEMIVASPEDDWHLYLLSREDYLAFREEFSKVYISL